MAAKKKKDSYAIYKTENRGYKNKIRKLERHCKKFPEDKVGQENLERLRDPKNYKHRTKPNNPGTNRPNPQVYRFRPSAPGPRTAGEQLSELLGISMPKIIRRRKKVKTAVVIKKKKNVTKS